MPVKHIETVVPFIFNFKFIYIVLDEDVLKWSIVDREDAYS